MATTTFSKPQSTEISELKGNLLWTNSASSLGDTTIVISNLYTYDEIRVIWNDADSGDNRVTYAIPIVGTTFILCGIDIDPDKDYAHAFNIRTRKCEFVATGIHFKNGQMVYNNGVYKDWPSRAYPVKIYGIKY